MSLESSVMKYFMESQVTEQYFTDPLECKIRYWSTIFFQQIFRAHLGSWSPLYEVYREAVWTFLCFHRLPRFLDYFLINLQNSGSPGFARAASTMATPSIGDTFLNYDCTTWKGRAAKAKKKQEIDTGISSGDASGPQTLLRFLVGA